jgi:hypothetical protein
VHFSTVVAAEQKSNLQLNPTSIKSARGDPGDEQSPQIASIVIDLRIKSSLFFFPRIFFRNSSGARIILKIDLVYYARQIQNSVALNYEFIPDLFNFFTLRKICFDLY